MRNKGEIEMYELIRTNNPVLISWLQSNLSDVGIDVVILDEHMSVLDGSVMAIPRRVMVDEVHQAVAKAILAEAEAL